MDIDAQLPPNLE